MEHPISFKPNIPDYIYRSNCIEFWNPINPIYVPDLDNRYWVSTFGRVYDTKKQRFMNQTYDSKKYLKVSIFDKYNKMITRKVHRLLMMSFYYFPGCEKYEVNHIDGNHENNNNYNLEWVTGSENRLHAIRNNLEQTIFGVQICILSDEQVEKIRVLALQGYRNRPSEIIKILNLQNVPSINKNIINKILDGSSKLYNKYPYCEYDNY